MLGRGYRQGPLRILPQQMVGKCGIRLKQCESFSERQHRRSVESAASTDSYGLPSDQPSWRFFGLPEQKVKYLSSPRIRPGKVRMKAKCVGWL